MSDDNQFDIAALEKEEAGTHRTASISLDDSIAFDDTIDPDSESPISDGSASDVETDLDLEAPATADDSDSEPEAEEVEEVINPCLECGVEKDPRFPMCRSCGYYETLGTFVEVDDDDPDEIIGANDGGFKMPTWGWILIGIQVFIVLESLFVVLNFKNGGTVRTVWSIAQLLIGFSVGLAAHARATFLSVMEDADSDMGDFFMKPLKVWGAVIGGLPKTFPWLAMVTSGAMAVLLSLCLIRSIPFNKMFETDAPPPKAPNLAKAIADQAREGEDPDMTMEEALDEFAGEALEEEELDALRTHAQGVIVGYYSPDGDVSTISSVIVAAAVKKKLEIFGTFSAGLDDELKAKLAEDFLQIRRKRPFVETSLTAKWVQPVYLCEISYKLDEKERPRELKFERIVGKTKIPRKKKAPIQKK